MMIPRIDSQPHCTQCHERGEAADSAGPSLSQLGVNATPVRMATAMWNHGETMLEQMTEAGISWPVFSDNEMVDLLAFLSADESSADSDH